MSLLFATEMLQNSATKNVIPTLDNEQWGEPLHGVDNQVYRAGYIGYMASVDDNMVYSGSVCKSSNKRAVFAATCGKKFTFGANDTGIYSRSNLAIFKSEFLAKKWLNMYTSQREEPLEWWQK